MLCHCNNETYKCIGIWRKTHVIDVNDEIHDKLLCWEKIHAVSVNNDRMEFIHTSARRKRQFMSVKGPQHIHRSLIIDTKYIFKHTIKS